MEFHLMLYYMTETPNKREDNFEVALEKRDEMFLQKAAGQRQKWGSYCFYSLYSAVRLIFH